MNRDEVFGRGFLVFEVQRVANSEKRQKAFASFIWRGALASAANRPGLATMMEMQRAREVATFSLLHCMQFFPVAPLPFANDGSWKSDIGLMT